MDVSSLDRYQSWILIKHLGLWYMCNRHRMPADICTQFQEKTNIKTRLRNRYESEKRTILCTMGPTDMFTNKLVLVCVFGGCFIHSHFNFNTHEFSFFRQSSGGINRIIRFSFSFRLLFQCLKKSTANDAITRYRCVCVLVNYFVCIVHTFWMANFRFPACNALLLLLLLCDDDDDDHGRNWRPEFFTWTFSWWFCCFYFLQKWTYQPHMLRSVCNVCTLNKLHGVYISIHASIALHCIRTHW